MTKNEHIPSGTVFENRYRIESILGAGGMGEVYVATHTTLGRKVAIKRLHAQYTSDSGVVQRFIQEAKLAASIGHDNICEVIDIGTAEDGAPYLVMPILEGGTLSELIDKQNKLSVIRLVDIICQTLSALSAAHDARIVHRDLKPDNIFVTKYGDRLDFVKLLDFGISKILDQDSVSQLTQTGTVLGTPYYMAPEQARGAREFDHRVDIYAMGVILYECLTGTKPYDGISYNEVMFKILAEPFQAPRVLDPSIPPSIEQIVITAMSRDPADRFGSAEVMRNALKQAATGIGTSVNTPPALTSAGTKMENDIAFTPTAISTATPMAKVETSTALTNSPTSSKKKKILVPAIIATLVAISIGITIFISFGNSDAEVVPIPIPVQNSIEQIQPATAPPVAAEPEPVPNQETEPTFVADLPPVETTDKKTETNRPKPPKNTSNKNSGKPTKTVVITEKPDKPPEDDNKDDDNQSLDGRFGTKFAPVYEE